MSGVLLEYSFEYSFELDCNTIVHEKFCMYTSIMIPASIHLGDCNVNGYTFKTSTKMLVT
jgi:hypothetical protein